MAHYSADPRPVHPSNLADSHMLDNEPLEQVYTTPAAPSSEPSAFVIPFLPDEYTSTSISFFSPLFFTEDTK